MSFLELQQKRRSIYAIGKDLPYTNDEILDLITKTTREIPSAFNSQSSRVVVLFGKESEEFWNTLVAGEVQKVAPPEAFEGTKQKLASFAAGVGTILLYEDQDVVAGLETQFPLYAANFSTWSEHAHGGTLYGLWLAFAEKGIGMTVQHYNPLVDAVAAERYHVPSHWKLRAQVPFGSIVAPADEKAYMADEDRIIVVGK